MQNEVLIKNKPKCLKSTLTVLEKHFFFSYPVNTTQNTSETPDFGVGRFSSHQEIQHQLGVL